MSVRERARACIAFALQNKALGSGTVYTLDERRRTDQKNVKDQAKTDDHVRGE